MQNTLSSGKTNKENNMEKCLDIKRLNWFDGNIVFLTDAPDDVIENKIGAALGKGEDEFNELVSLLKKEGYVVKLFDEVVTDFDF